jgi:hypothetical protein
MVLALVGDSTMMSVFAICLSSLNGTVTRHTNCFTIAKF